MCVSNPDRPRISCIDGREAFSLAPTTLAALIQTFAVRPRESIADTQPYLQPALMSLSAMISQSFTRDLVKRVCARVFFGCTVEFSCSARLARAHRRVVRLAAFCGVCG